MRIPLENLALKVLSLGLAVLLWFVIAGEKTSEMGLNVPVELQNFPKDLELTGEPVNTVEVRLRASPGIIKQLGPGEVSAQIDLAGTTEGERIVHLAPDAIRVPFGVKVVKINPAILTLNFERTLQKVVPIRPRLLGRPARGYEVAEVTSEPHQARISGPKSRVEEVESAFTEPVSLDAAQSTVVQEATVGVEDPVLRILGSPRVRVVARIREEHEKRAFEGVGVALRGGSGVAAPARIAVTVEGPVSVVRRMAPGDVRPFVDASRVPTSRRLPVAVELAPGFTGVAVRQVEPAEVVVHPARRKD